VFLNGEPLHVVWRVRSASAERGYVINLPPRAGQSVAPSGWAFLLRDKLMPRLLAALNTCIGLQRHESHGGDQTNDRGADHFITHSRTPLLY